MSLFLCVFLLFQQPESPKKVEYERSAAFGNGKSLFTMPGVCAAQFSPDGKWIAAWSTPHAHIEHATLHIEYGPERPQ